MIAEVNVPSILASYGATLSNEDVSRIKLLFNGEKDKLFDLSNYYPIMWGRKGLEKYESLKKLGPSLWNRPQPDEVLDLIDANLMFLSARFLPLNLNLDFNEECKLDSFAQTLYDPRFFLPLFNILLSPENVMNCKKFVWKNCLLYCFSCLSCYDVNLRQLSYYVIFKFRKFLDATMEKSDEKSQLIYLLTLFRNSLQKPNVRLSSVIGNFLGRSSNLIFNPYDRMFPLISSFLLLKPILDLENVPEFLKFFHSSTSLDFVHERHWILNLLLDGLREIKDYRIYEKRYVFKLLLSFYNCCLCDGKSKEFIEKILKSACRIKPCAADLCFNHNLLGWICSNVQKINFNDEHSKLNSTAEILLQIGETLKDDEKTFNSVKFQWLACFYFIVRIYKENKLKNIILPFDESRKKRLLKIAKLITVENNNGAFEIESKKLLENF